MTEQVINISAIIFIYLFFFIGSIGCFLPVIPGPLIATCALLICKLAVDSIPISWTLVVVSILVAIISQVIDILGTWLGAKKFGATWRGILGAFIGVFVALFIPPQIIWIFVAPIVGALALEWLGGADLRTATKAGIGTFIGTVVASALKFVMVIATAIWFTLEIVFV